MLKTHKSGVLMFILMLSVSTALVCGCQHKPLTDDDLAVEFSANEKWFAQIASRYTSKDVVCSDAHNPDICLINGAKNAIAQVRKGSHVESVYIKRNRAGDDGIWLPVQTYGALSIRSSTRGYVYLRKKASSLVADTLEIDEKGSYYKPLKNGW